MPSLEETLLARFNKNNFKNRQLYLTPMLDKDPIFAANFLTVKDSKEAIETLRETYKLIEDGEYNKNAMTTLVTFSKISFEWFSSFTIELCRLEGMLPTFIPYGIKDLLGDCPFANVQCPPVFYNSNKKSVEKREYSINPDVDAVTLWRISYIKEQYEPSDFREESFPAWYVMSETEIYEGYSVKTNTRVKVTFSNGELNYYIAGASDNWKKIVGVPTEMDHVISALIFKNSYQEYY